MDQAAVEHAPEDMKKAFLQQRMEQQAAFNEPKKRLDAAIDGQAKALASAAAHRSEAAIYGEKKRALLEETGGMLSQEVKNFQKKIREHLLAAEEDDETAREIQPIIDRLKIEASDRAKALVQWEDIFLKRVFEQMAFDETRRFARNLHAIIQIEAKRRHNDNGAGEMCVIHNDDHGWVVADLIQGIRLALADEDIDPEPISDDVKAVLELTNIGSFVPLTVGQRHKLAAGLNGSASGD